MSTADAGTSPLSYAGMLGLRLVQDRERQIASHKPQSCWMASAQLNVEGISFTAKVLNARGSPLALRTATQADHLVRILNPAVYWVEGLIRGARTHPAPASLTVGALIETASRDLGLSTARVLSVLVTLYEAGWIVHPEAQRQAVTRESALAFIQREYGQDYVAPESVETGGLAPVDIARVPEDGSGDGAAIYGLIWRHFVASHMAPAQESITAARIRVGPARDKKYPIELRATSRTTLFEGWTRVLKDREQETAYAWLARLKEGVTLQLERVDTRQVTRPAAQPYTESTLAHALADAGVSLTEAVAAIAHLHSTGLLASVDGSQTLTDAGQSLAQRLVEHFDDLTGMTCAEELAADIERVAAGETSRADVLRAFWSRYGERLSASEEVLL
ncbi:MAG: hypothetical protein H3C32_16920 [Anaerolineae bacterium]|nr:hypothetical protein [Anaerolineae bacterium]